MSQKVVLQLDGMTCQACASRIEKVLNKKPFVENAAVNFASEMVLVQFDERQADVEQIIQVIEKVGFKAQREQPQAGQNAPKLAILAHWRLILLWLINLPFLVGMFGMFSHNHSLMLPPLWQFALASMVQLWLAVPFYRSAIASLKGGLANMDLLVSSGTLIIYLYSVWALFSANHVYFEAAVMVIAFVSLGKFLEERTKKQSLNSIQLLLKLTPKQVKVKRANSTEWQSLPVAQVQIGDEVQANIGERICADGVVQSGAGWADESHLTGESAPEEKQAGSKVLAGSVMTQGSLIYRAEQLGNQTLLGDMMQALSEAQGSKAPIARLADKVAGVFVPVVMAIALLTFILTGIFSGDWTQALVHGVAVLVIACPCALGLATPASIMVGMGRASRAGIWFKDAAAMERSAAVNTVVLDKTGTLTEGKPQLVATFVAPESGVDEEQLLRLAAAVEQQANHPLAKTIVEATFANNLPISTACKVQNVVGMGVQAEIDGVGVVKVGKPEYCGLTLPENLGGVWRVASIVAVALNDQPLGAFALADQLKADSLRAIQRLQQRGIEVQIMSGDHQSVVDYIAQQLGITRAYGNLSPRDKAQKVAELKAQGKVVAMVGDGVNDAPALAAADVSFAMKNGADVAEHTASATLMQHSVDQLVNGLLIAQATVKNIKQNLFFAFVYNILGIPLAALGYLSPVLAGAAMALSSISVLSNALRLKKQRIE